MSETKDYPETRKQIENVMKDAQWKYGLVYEISMSIKFDDPYVEKSFPVSGAICEEFRKVICEEACEKIRKIIAFTTK